MNSRKILSFIFSILIFSLTAVSISAQDENQKSPCFQDKEEKLKLIEKAELNQYNVKYIEIVGNTYTRYSAFGKHFALGEGDIFTKNRFDKTIDGFNKVKKIYPINLENVKVSLSVGMFSNGKANIINLTFCVEQKEKK